MKVGSTSFNSFFRENKGSRISRTQTNIVAAKFMNLDRNDINSSIQGAVNKIIWTNVITNIHRTWALVWCGNVDTRKNNTKKSGSLRNVMLPQNVEDSLVKP